MIPVSILPEFLFCPRSVYLKEVLGLKPLRSFEQTCGLVGHCVRKELSLRYARIIEKCREPINLEELLLYELDAVIGDVPHIYAEKLEGMVDGEYEKVVELTRGEIIDEVRTIAVRWIAMIDQLGIENTLIEVKPLKAEYYLESDNLGLKGKIDKVMTSNRLVEIKTGRPARTVWDSDKVQLCAYGMLLGEDVGELVKFGFIEYTRIGESRPVMFTEDLRRRVVDTRDNVVEIIEGLVPDVCPHGNHKKCAGCGLEKSCYTV